MNKQSFFIILLSSIMFRTSYGMDTKKDPFPINRQMVELPPNASAFDFSLGLGHLASLFTVQHAILNKLHLQRKNSSKIIEEIFSDTSDHVNSVKEKSLTTIEEIKKHFLQNQSVETAWDDINEIIKNINFAFFNNMTMERFIYGTEEEKKTIQDRFKSLENAVTYSACCKLTEHDVAVSQEDANDVSKIIALLSKTNLPCAFNLSKQLGFFDDILVNFLQNASQYIQLILKAHEKPYTMIKQIKGDIPFTDSHLHCLNVFMKVMDRNQKLCEDHLVAPNKAKTICQDFGQKIDYVLKTYQEKFGSINSFYQQLYQALQGAIGKVSGTQRIRLNKKVTVLPHKFPSLEDSMNNIIYSIEQESTALQKKSQRKGKNKTKNRKEEKNGKEEDHQTEFVEQQLLSDEDVIFQTGHSLFPTDNQYSSLDCTNDSGYDGKFNQENPVESFPAIQDNEDVNNQILPTIEEMQKLSTPQHIKNITEALDKQYTEIEKLKNIIEEHDNFNDMSKPLNEWLTNNEKLCSQEYAGHSCLQSIHKLFDHVKQFLQEITTENQLKFLRQIDLVINKFFKKTNEKIEPIESALLSKFFGNNNQQREDFYKYYNPESAWTQKLADGMRIYDIENDIIITLPNQKAHIISEDVSEIPKNGNYARIISSAIDNTSTQYQKSFHKYLYIITHRFTTIVDSYIKTHGKEYVIELRPTDHTFRNKFPIESVEQKQKQIDLINQRGNVARVGFHMNGTITLITTDQKFPCRIEYFIDEHQKQCFRRSMYIEGIKL